MRRNTKLIWITVSIVAVLWSLCLAVAYLVFGDWPARGQFGDTFGAVNALFSGLAFAFLIISVNMQRRELTLQRRELRHQRQEMEASNKALLHQANAQLLLARATVAQLFAAANQVEVDAIKLEATGIIQGAQLQQIQAIRTIGESMAETAEDLKLSIDQTELEMRGAPTPEEVNQAINEAAQQGG